MITEWLIGLIATVGDWFVGLFPRGPAPVFLTSLDDRVNELIRSVGGAAVWADWVYMLSVAGIVAAVWAAGLLVKFLLKIAAFIPMVGGSG